MQRGNLPFLLSHILRGPYCTFFTLAGGLEFATLNKLCHYYPWRCLFTNDQAPQPQQTKDDTLHSESELAEWMGLQMRFMRGEIGICPLAKTPTKAGNEARGFAGSNEQWWDRNRKRRNGI